MNKFLEECLEKGIEDMSMAIPNFSTLGNGWVIDPKDNNVIMIIKISLPMDYLCAINVFSIPDLEVKQTGQMGELIIVPQIQQVPTYDEVRMASNIEQINNVVNANKSNNNLITVGIEGHTLNNDAYKLIGGLNRTITLSFGYGENQYTTTFPKGFNVDMIIGNGYAQEGLLFTTPIVGGNVSVEKKVK